MLIICSYTDIRERLVDLRAVYGFMLLAAVIFLYCYKNDHAQDMGILLYGSDPVGIIVSMLPGLLLILSGRLSKGMIGEGDGHVILVLGLMMGLENLIRVIATGFFIAFFAGVLTVALNKTVFRREKCDSIPLIPCLLIGYILVYPYVSSSF
ncbi:MAG: prepilin peptidase [Lachnospiraceae bacterium]|nr:prepilin peptidase [Lachnospiraceae bacterium]